MLTCPMIRQKLNGIWPGFYLYRISMYACCAALGVCMV